MTLAPPNPHFRNAMPCRVCVVPVARAAKPQAVDELLAEIEEQRRRLDEAATVLRMLRAAAQRE